MDTYTAADRYGNHFTAAVDAVAAKMAFFDIDFAKHYDAARRADDVVVDTVADLIGAVEPANVDDLAAKFVGGKLKATTVIDRLHAAKKTVPTDFVNRVAAVKRAGLADKVASTADLKADARRQISDQIVAVAERLSAAVHAAPGALKPRLTQVVDGPNGSTIYGMKIDDALDVFDLKTVSGDDLDAARELIAAAAITKRGVFGEGHDAAVSDIAFAFDVDPADVHLSAIFFGAPGAVAVDAFRHPRGNAVAYVIAAGYADIDVLADPFGADRDAYEARVDELKKFRSWRAEEEKRTGWYATGTRALNDYRASDADFDFTGFGDDQISQAVQAFTRYGHRSELAGAAIAAGYGTDDFDQARRGAEADVYGDGPAK